MAQDVPDLIATLEDERYAAMLSGDKVKLDRLMDDRDGPGNLDRGIGGVSA
jgi:hypothetical protein